MEKVTNVYDFKKQKLIEKIDSLLERIDYFKTYLNNPKPLLTNNVISFKQKN